MTRTRTTLALVLAGTAALAAVPAQAGVSAARKPQKKTVAVGDNYFQPSRLTVNRDSTVRFAWADDAAEIHDVKLVKGPRGVKKWQSEPGGFGYVYRRTLRKPGTYRLVCTFHVADGMKMTIVVRRR